MKMQRLLIIPGLLIAALSISSCSKDVHQESTMITDEALSRLMTQTLSESGTTIVERKKSQGFRVKMNEIAHDSKGGAYLPNSVMIKEYVNSIGEVSAYDLMVHAPNDSRSVNGWLWASFNADGETVYSVNARGAKCQSCHGPDRNITGFTM
ncbi:MAG: hypothetical protein DWQ44_01210 [Bacteroidetes bacterium]|nr:MAG: hypothetical protein DWQ33_00675 [Bacteroidota bacterium]REK04964.1 MAG: hypothetical protein DWQ39_07045 [Bacteroidota bacterium]REK36532.1 MAG: hypothetical protein DWQ44_01210 [Bacteroidota bacterium]REK50898.1 MAG: hypothetical protein DWQ48_02070 [Bacteroidota bacterium]